jgi:hypothetical protein
LNTKIREFFKTQGKEVNDLPYDILPPLNSPGNPSQQFLDEVMGAAAREKKFAEKQTKKAARKAKSTWGKK